MKRQEFKKFLTAQRTAVGGIVGGIIFILGMLASCVFIGVSGPLSGIYIILSRSLHRFRGAFFVATLGALITIGSLVIDATIHTEEFTAVFQDFSMFTNLGAIFNPAMLFFPTHLTQVLGWILIITGSIASSYHYLRR